MTEVCGIVATNQCLYDNYVTFMDDFQSPQYLAAGSDAYCSIADYLADPSSRDTRRTSDG